MADWRTRALVLVAVLLVGLGLGAGLVALLDDTDDGPIDPVPNRVDVGFSQDMSLHHHQGVELAQAMLQVEDPMLRSLAFGMASAQLEELGRMQGYLELWNAPTLPAGAPMEWMRPEPADHSHSVTPTAPHEMPGLASAAQMQQLYESTGRTRDVLFLQLMIRHHQGAVQMADFAIQNAALPQTRALAARMSFEQSQEIARLVQMLGARAAKSAPPG